MHTHAHTCTHTHTHTHTHLLWWNIKRDNPQIDHPNVIDAGEDEEEPCTEGKDRNSMQKELDRLQANERSLKHTWTLGFL